MKKQGVNPELDKLMADLLKKVQKSVRSIGSEKVEPMPTDLMDMIRVIDRCIQWEKVKHHIKDEDWGKGFDDEGAENE